MSGPAAATRPAPPGTGRGERPARRARVVLILGALSAFGPLSIDMYLPGRSPRVEREQHRDPGRVVDEQATVALAASRRARAAASSASSATRIVQWRRPATPSGAGAPGMPAPRHVLKPRWWW